MKNIYFEIKDRFPINADIQLAIDGFINLGYDKIKTFTIDDIDFISKNNMFVGSIDIMSKIFKNFGKYPIPIDFPDEILKSGILNREIKFTNLFDAITLFKNNYNPIFIKPVETKIFNGILIENEVHLNYFNELNNIDVIICDKIDIASEHRAYIHKNELIYCCNYNGDFRINPDYNYIDKLISIYKKNAPVSYTIDIGILKDNSNTVIEFNDFWAISGYGIKSWDYAQMLYDRYFEIIN